jgi:hypothetical protein
VGAGHAGGVKLLYPKLYVSMIIICHRGLLEGPDSLIENAPLQIDKALSLGFEVEVDLFVLGSDYFLGHDRPTYRIEKEWLIYRKKRSWIHCKNLEAMLALAESGFNYFWHETDTIALTRKGYVWAYPGKQPIANSIAVLPELNNDDIRSCLGICTDYPSRYKEALGL